MTAGRRAPQARALASTEIEDLSAVLDACGASRVFGLSAGAVIAIEAARLRPDITRLALYEPPLTFDGAVHGDWAAAYERQLAAGRPGAALVTVLKATADRTSPIRWIPARPMAFHPSREDRWVFGDRKTGGYLVKHAWTKIRRHVMVKGRATPDDPGLTGYWRYRRDKHGTALDSATTTLLGRQGNRCPVCGGQLIDPSHLPGSAEQWQDWWYGITRQATGHAPGAPGQQPGTRSAATSLIHTPCHRARQARQRNNAALQPATP